VYDVYKDCVLHFESLTTSCLVSFRVNYVFRPSSIGRFLFLSLIQKMRYLSPSRSETHGIGPHFKTPLVLLQSWQTECHARIPFLTMFKL